MPAQWHDRRFLFGALRLRVSYGILDQLAVDLMGSLRIVRIGFALQDLGRRPIEAPHGEELHYRSETPVGLTDPWLGLRFSGALGGWALPSRPGATLSLGATIENLFRLGREGRPHQHIQLGTGTVDPCAEVLLQRRVGRFPLGGWLLARAPL